MSFPYTIDWSPNLRTEAADVRERDTFGGFLWPERPRLALLPSEFNPKHPPIPCPRCGFERVVRNNNRAQLCRDCSGALTADERKAWAA